MIFFDSGFLLAFINEDDPKHARTVPVMDRALKGEFGRMVVSNFIIDEVLSLARVRTKSCDCGKAIHKFLRKTKDKKRLFLEIGIDEVLMKSTTAIYWKYCEAGFSFTDCSILAVGDFLSISHLATFDDHFRGLTTVLP